MEQPPQDTIRAELTPGERLLWTGTPDLDTLFSPADRFLIPFTVVWVALVVLPFLMVDLGEFWFLAIPFLAIASFVLFGRIMLRARRKRRTVYALTDRRVLIVEVRSGPNRVQSAFLASLPGLDLREAKNGLGTITFGAVTPLTSLIANSGLERLNPYTPLPMAFYELPEARGVHDLIVKARETAR